MGVGEDGGCEGTRDGVGGGVRGALGKGMGRDRGGGIKWGGGFRGFGKNRRLQIWGIVRRKVPETYRSTRPCLNFGMSKKRRISS